MVLHKSSDQSSKQLNHNKLQEILPGASNSPAAKLDDKKDDLLQDDRVHSTTSPRDQPNKLLESDSVDDVSSTLSGDVSFESATDENSEKSSNVDDNDLEDVQEDSITSTCQDDGYCTSDQESVVAEVDESKYEVKSIPGKGRGMFATKRIYPGELIMSEQPLLICPSKTFSDQEKCEKFLDKAIVKMTENQRKRFFSLSDCRSVADPSYLGIFYTNDMDWDDDVCLCPNMARANHSCSPNAEFCTRKDIGEQRLVAISTIEVGEEITISYMSAADEGSEIRKHRQSYLRIFYGFQCICKLCNLQGEDFEKDEALREELKEIQSNGIDNLDLAELERLLYLCSSVFPKTSYLLVLLETMYEHAQDQVDKYFQCVRALSLAISCFGEDSEVADTWRKRTELDPIRSLEIVNP